MSTSTNPSADSPAPSAGNPTPVSSSPQRPAGSGDAKRRRRTIRMGIVLGLFGLFVVAAVLATRIDTEATDSIVKKMREAFNEAERLRIAGKKNESLQKLAETKGYAHRVLARNPNSPVANLLLGQSLIRESQPIEALSYFRNVEDNTREAALCYVSAAQILCDQYSQFREAEDYCRRAIRIQPNETPPLQTLAYVLRVGARNWDREPIEMESILQGLMDIRSMEWLAQGNRLGPQRYLVEQGIQRNPNDPNVLLGHGEMLADEGKYKEAANALRQAIEVAPTMLEPKVRLGEVLVRSGDDAAFLEWYTKFGKTLSEHPTYWTACAQRARRAGELQTAARCYWEAVRRDPNNQEAEYQLGQLLIELGRSDDAAPFLDRNAKLVAYQIVVRQNALRSLELGGRGDVELASQALKASDELGNIWEVAAWLQMMRELDQSNKAISQQLEQMQSVVLKADKRRTLPNYNPAGKVNLVAYPLPQWNSATPRLADHEGAGTPSEVRFEDQADNTGLKFTYIDGANPEIHALNKMFQINGGGVGVLDYDRDGWPDVYFTQGSKDPQDHDQTDFLDCLFRNRGDGHFVDVSIPANLREESFSQGVSVGDINNDGFPDLFVANVGPNRLYENNGDGTFSDATESAGVGDSRWTSSCVIADLNGDGLPDIYAVGFLEGDALTRICNTKEKRLDTCFPTQFPGSSHRLWLNQGNGHFQDVAAAAGVDRPDGQSLSIIAANVEGSGKLDLLIGNYERPNFYYRNVSAKGAPPKFSEVGATAGLAYARDGAPRATLGLAAGDFDGDGRLDFRGTSLPEEPDTLLLQRAKGRFEDNSVAAGLSGDTFLIAGYGTQPIDGDLDGNLDLLTANGNSDAIRTEYLQYEMQPTFWHNDGHGRFSLVSPQTLGPYFEKKYRGRSVARLDWNRDGREDAVVLHSGAPAALLTNTTAKVGHHLTIRLSGTQSARDAVGTTVEVTAGKSKRTRQLTAGDGFQASNERALVFGLKDATSADSVVIHWISGRVQRLSKVAADQEILVIEGRDEPVLLSNR